MSVDSPGVEGPAAAGPLRAVSRFTWRRPGLVTLGQVSTRSKDLAGGGATGNVEAAKRVGKAVAELARRLEIDEVVFHRNGFLYHGRVKALAEAAREAGLRF